MVFGFVTKDDQLFQKKQVIVALNAIYQLFPGLFEKRLRKQINKIMHNVEDDLFHWAAYLVAKTKLCWILLEDSAKYKIERFILVAPSSLILKGLSTFAKFDEVRGAVTKRVAGLDYNELATIVSEHDIHEMVKARAIELLAESHSWEQANDIFYNLIFPLVNGMIGDDFRKIVSLPKETGADLVGSHGLRLFVDIVRSTGRISQSDLDCILEENDLEFLVKKNQA